MTRVSLSLTGGFGGLCPPRRRSQGGGLGGHRPPIINTLSSHSHHISTFFLGSGDPLLCGLFSLFLPPSDCMCTLSPPSHPPSHQITSHGKSHVSDPEDIRKCPSYSTVRKRRDQSFCEGEGPLRCSCCASRSRFSHATDWRSRRRQADFAFSSRPSSNFIHPRGW